MQMYGIRILSTFKIMDKTYISANVHLLFCFNQRIDDHAGYAHAED